MFYDIYSSKLNKLFLITLHILCLPKYVVELMSL